MRSFLMLCALGLLLCAAPTAAQTSDLGFWTCQTSVAGQTLHVYNWTTYIAEDTISNFERLCHVTLVYTTYGSDSDMVAELEAGNPGYDVVVPTDSTVYGMIAENLLMDWDVSSLPNWADVDPRFKAPPYDPQNRYTAPYQWGTDGVGYNRTKIGKDITSWDQVFNYNGPVAWIDEPRIMLGIVLKLLGKDPNSTNAADIDAAVQYLIAHKANVYAIGLDNLQPLLVSGKVDMIIKYSGDIFQVIKDCQCSDYAYVIPSEGSIKWIDNLAIPVGAPNPALAKIFIDYILDPQVGADISNYTAYGSPNKGAVEEGLISSKYLDNPSIYPSDQLLANLFYNVSSDPNIDKLFSDAWAKVKTAVGK